MEKGNYYKEVNEYVTKKLNETKINDVFKPIITEIILRRRDEYQLEDKYFKRDVKSFIQKVKQIYMLEFPEDYNNIGGLFNSNTKRIILNKNTLLKDEMSEDDYQKIIETLAHECYHAMNFDKNNYDRTFKKDDRNSFVSNLGIMELFTEKESNRTIVNRTPWAAFMYKNETRGYPMTTGYANIIASTFGIKEKDLLQAAIQGKKEFNDLLGKNIKNEKYANLLYENIAFNINLEHLEFYPAPDENKDFNIKNILYADGMIYESAEQGINYRITNLEFENIEDLKNKIEEFKINQNSINQIMEGRLKAEEYRRYVSSFAINTKQIVYAKLTAIDEFIKSQDNELGDKITKISKATRIQEIEEIMEENNFSLDENMITVMPQFELSPEKRAEWIKEFCLDGRQWDNSEMTDYIRNNLEEIKNITKRKTIIDKIMENIYNVIGKIKRNNKTVLLPPSPKQHNNSIKEKSWDLSNWGISKEDINRMNETKANQINNSVNIDKSTKETENERE